MDPRKVDVVKQWPTPHNKTELRRFLGFAAYYRRFIQEFAKIASPLTKLSGKTDFAWSEEAAIAFATLKSKLTQAPILAFPEIGQNAGQFVLDTDASNTAVGAVLSQMINGQERVIAYGSHALSKSEKNYCTTRKELLALIYFLKQFRLYLLGRHFIVRIVNLSRQPNLDEESQRCRRSTRKMTCGFARIRFYATISARQ